jgi:predicted esterase YcpF (UPF0227 family)
VIYYIHGFNSSSINNLDKQNQLKDIFNKDIILLDYNFNLNANHIFNELLTQIQHINEETIIIGSSLGGFFAYTLASNISCKCILFNPCYKPHEILKDNNLIIDINILNSYENLFNCIINNAPALVILGKNDDLIDYKKSFNYFKDKAEIIITEEEHRITNLIQFKEKFKVYKELLPQWN